MSTIGQPARIAFATLVYGCWYLRRQRAWPAFTFSSAVSYSTSFILLGAEEHFLFLVIDRLTPIRQHLHTTHNSRS